MPEKLGTLPPPAVEREAWERLWKAYPRSWKQLPRAFVKKMARGTEQCCYNARSGMCVAVSECPDLEFLCPNCPAGAKTWPTRAALRSHMMSKHGWRNPWRQFVAGSCCPCLSKAVPTHVPERLITWLIVRSDADKRYSRTLISSQNWKPTYRGKLDQQDQQERRKAVKQGKSWLTAFLPGGLMQTKLSVIVDRNVDLCSPQQFVLSFVLCFCSPLSLKLVITWVTMLLIGALVSCACLSFVFVVHSSFRVCIACTVCAAERDYRARLLHTTTV